METFSRDNLYLKQKLGLQINVEFTRRGGRTGHTNTDTTVAAFRSADIYNIYRIIYYNIYSTGRWGRC